MSRQGISDEALQQVLDAPRVRQVPRQAYGPEPLTPLEERPPVWVWVFWSDGRCTREMGWASAANDRVVALEIITERGTQRVVAWRSAVTRRTP